MENEIIPAILSDSVAEVQKKLDLVSGFAKWAQIDVMDGAFVDTASFELEDFKKIETELKLEAHLMVEYPLQYLTWCKKNGFSRVIFHIESKDDASEVIQKYRENGMQIGIALNPETSVEEVEPYLMWIDLVLFLGVNPGKGGQEFIEDVLEKISTLRKDNQNVVIEVDGGVNASNILEIKKAGASIFVVGSGLYLKEDIEAEYNHLLLV